MTHRPSLSIAGMLVSTAMLYGCGESMGLHPSGLAILSGDGQSGVAGQPLAQPLAVTVANGSGRAVIGAQIHWEATTGGGSVGFITYTDSTGTASATWILGVEGRTQTARASLSILADSAPGSSTPVNFTATANGAATQLALIGGNSQTAIIDDTLPVALRVRATNELGAGVAGVRVNWATVAGAGQVPSRPTVTDADGEAAVTWVLGPTVGAQTATATVPGLTGSPLRFVATATQAANTLTWASESLASICPCPSGRWWGIWASSPSDVFAVGGRGTIRHFNGSSWELQNSGATNDLLVVSGNSPNDVFAGGNYGTILHYDGASWSTLAIGTASAGFSGMWGSSSSDEFAVACGSGIWHYDGSVWTQQTSTMCSAAVWGSSGRDVFAVGDVVSHYDGTTWSKQNSGNFGLDSVLIGIWGSGPADVYAVGHEGPFRIDDPNILGLIEHYDGTSWSRQLTMTGRLSAASGASSTDVVAVGSNGVILHYDGTRWRRESSGTTQPIVAVSVSSARDVWAITAAGLVLHGTR